MYEFEKWKIEIDLEGTRSYYEQLQIQPRDLEAWNNYCIYLESMSKEEKKFFEKFGILPYKCDVNSFGLSKKGYLTYGTYLVKGEYLEIPQEIHTPFENVNDEEISFLPEKSPEFEVGIFSFKFLRDVEIFRALKDIPEGFICLEFMVDELPWLLEEEPQNIMPEYVEWWQPLKKVKEMKQQQKRDIRLNQEILQEIIWDLKSQNIPFRMMKKDQVQLFKKCWFDAFAPKENRKKAKKVCLPKGWYLWHLFSYKYAECMEKERALAAFARCEKSDCYLYLSYMKFGIKIRNADKFIWKDKNIYEDFLLTDKDFTWTFAHTHEEQCGPYFKKDADIVDTLHFT